MISYLILTIKIKFQYHLSLRRLLDGGCCSPSSAYYKESLPVSSGFYRLAINYYAISSLFSMFSMSPVSLDSGA